MSEFEETQVETPISRDVATDNAYNYTPPKGMRDEPWESNVLTPINPPTMTLNGSTTVHWNLVDGLQSVNKLGVYIRQTYPLQGTVNVLATFNNAGIAKLNLKMQGAELYDSSQVAELSNILCMSDVKYEVFANSSAHIMRSTALLSEDGNFGNQGIASIVDGAVDNFGSNAVLSSATTSTLLDGAVSRQGFIQAVADATGVGDDLTVVRTGFVSFSQLGGFFLTKQAIPMTSAILEITFAPTIETGFTYTNIGATGITAATALGTSVSAMTAQLIQSFARQSDVMNEIEARAASSAGISITFNKLTSQSTALTAGSGVAQMSVPRGLLVRAGNLFYNGTASSMTKLMTGESLWGANPEAVQLQTSLGSINLHKNSLTLADGGLRAEQYNAFKGTVLARDNHLRAYPCLYDIFGNADNLQVVENTREMSGREINHTTQYTLRVSGAANIIQCVQFIEMKYQLVIQNGRASVHPVEP